MTSTMIGYVASGLALAIVSAMIFSAFLLMCGERSGKGHKIALHLFSRWQYGVCAALLLVGCMYVQLEGLSYQTHQISVMQEGTAFLKDRNLLYRQDGEPYLLDEIKPALKAQGVDVSMLTKELRDYGYLKTPIDSTTTKDVIDALNELVGDPSDLKI
jgi:hypothetical protein|tara:strand:- start:1704 stop:2177 length:474 start_codon:yes stop_codon:yes gene_type:complete